MEAATCYHFGCLTIQHWYTCLFGNCHALRQIWLTRFNHQHRCHLVNLY
jgi:hypothetical protein